ncbi:MAG: 30S ribosomal protein S16 [Acidobacteriota bacterium]
MVKIRLRRMGAKNAPFYRVVVSDSRKFPSSTAIEELGYFDPRRNPKAINIKEDRVQHWVSQGAQVSPTVQRLLGKNNVDVAEEATAEA